ncbi:hypothetical protein FACS1894189_8450 [Planctomycetales bacterium]|nr:hypothetical protein FACS1894189_8450 [Planctomycetales bacterium]
MPKFLCLFSLVVSSMIILIFLIDMIAGVPFGFAGGYMANLGMIAGAGIVGTFSFLTFREIR